MNKPKPDWTTRGALLAVMAAALAVGTWSVYTLLHGQFHAPKPVAVFGCGMFDGAAFFFARLAQRYATSPDSGFAPRAAMLAMVCTSAWVNWQHASIQHWGRVGQVVMAAAPIIAELAFEMWHRWEHREALRARGRVPQALPALGRWAWLLHPRQAFGAVDAHVVAHLDAATASATTTSVAPERVTLERTDTTAATPASPAQHQLTILVQQAPQLPAAPVHTVTTTQPAAPREAPVMLAGQATGPAPARPAEPLIATPAPLTETPRIDGLSKADAVRTMRAALPDATAAQIAQHLAQQGVTADAAYFRTVESRDRATARRATDPGTGQYL